VPIKSANKNLSTVVQKSADFLGQLNQAHKNGRLYRSSVICGKSSCCLCHVVTAKGRLNIDLRLQLQQPSEARRHSSATSAAGTLGCSP